MIRSALLVAAASTALTAVGHAAPIGSTDGSVTIARMLVATPVRLDPRNTSPLLATIAPVRPLTRQQTALPVVDAQNDQAGHRWLRVRLPGRPNGRAGWIRAGSARLVSSPWRVVVVRSRREAVLLQDGRIVERLRVVIGKPATPTPRGQFFVVEHVAQADGSPLGRWALATSAHSNVLQEFDGGPGPDRAPRATRALWRSIHSERLPRTAVSGSTMPLSIVWRGCCRTGLRSRSASAGRRRDVAATPHVRRRSRTRAGRR